VRDNLGHASLNTTSLYLHAEDDARHAATVGRHLIDWAHADNPTRGDAVNGPDAGEPGPAQSPEGT
jgi:hypothetical protein